MNWFKFFKLRKCEHENISDALKNQKIVKEIYVWEGDNSEPLDHYYLLNCPDCGQRVAYAIEW